jgi:hypothetical protein
MYQFLTVSRQEREISWQDPYAQNILARIIMSLIAETLVKIYL